MMQYVVEGGDGRQVSSIEGNSDRERYTVIGQRYCDCVDVSHGCGKRTRGLWQFRE